jgi:hypothetical protein
MKVTTALCKNAIVKMISSNPEIVESQFDDNESAEPAKLVKNWKRMYKEKNKDGTFLRVFDCTPYDDQLRAYVVDDGVSIISVNIEGE